MSAQYTHILLDRTDGVATITLNRPGQANAMSRELVQEVAAALNAVEADESVRVLIVTGAGGAFSSGFDLKQQAERRPLGKEAWTEMLALYAGTIMRFWNFPKPTIAAVNGACMAGGFELALACDLSIANEDSVFGEPELQFGAGIVAMILPWCVSPKVAKRVILMGEDTMNASEALAAGIVGRVVPADSLQSEAFKTALRISRMNPDLVRRTKIAINRAYEVMGMPRAIAEAVDIDIQIEAAGTPEKHEFLDRVKAEGMKAALAWRNSRFE